MKQKNIKKPMTSTERSKKSRLKSLMMGLNVEVIDGDCMATAASFMDAKMMSIEEKHNCKVSCFTSDFKDGLLSLIEELECHDDMYKIEDMEAAFKKVKKINLK